MQMVIGSSNCEKYVLVFFIIDSKIRIERLENVDLDSILNTFNKDSVECSTRTASAQIQQGQRRPRSTCGFRLSFIIDFILIIVIE